jgi:hypothetical protein
LARQAPQISDSATGSAQIRQRGDGNLGRLPRQAGHRSASPETPQSTQYLSKKLCLIFNLLFKNIKEEFDNDKRIYDDARSHHRIAQWPDYFTAAICCTAAVLALTLFS